MKKYAVLWIVFLFLFSLLNPVSAQEPENLHVISVVSNAYGSKKYGFADSNGKVRIGYIYDYAEEFSEGLALVNRNGRSFFINRYGAAVFNSLSSVYTYISGFKDGLALVEADEKYGYINTSGRLSIPLLYDDAFSFSEGLAAVCIDGKYGFINTLGKTVIDFKYDFASSFSDGKAKVLINGKYGFIDSDGNSLTPVIYEKAGNFSEGLCPVRINMKYSYINKFGFFAMPLMYDWAQDFENGIAMVCINDKFGYIDRYGNEVIKIKYKTLNRFEDGYLICSRKSGSSEIFGIVDKNENTLVPFQYDEITYIGSDLFIVCADGDFGIVKIDGLKYKVAVKTNYDFIFYDSGVIHAYQNGQETIINVKDL